jgi:hypothetical protein
MTTASLQQVSPDQGCGRWRRAPVNPVEIVSGLSAGDEVILSDMSAWDAYDRVRLQ